MISFYYYVHNLLCYFLIVLGEVFKADLTEVLVGVIDLNKVDQMLLIGRVVKMLASIF